MPISVQGVWPATLTPFTPAGELDIPALQAHIAEIGSTPGVTAVVVNGHAGEASSLNRDERKAVVALASKATSVPVVAGIVAEDPIAACEQARDAADAGAGALLLFPPALFAQGAGLRPDMIKCFVADVVAATALPIVLFQLSQASRQAFSPALLDELMQAHPSIVGIKDGSDSPTLYEDVLATLQAQPRKMGMLSSNNTWLMASLAYGGDGILSGLGSVAAPLLVELLAAMDAGDLARARAANARLQPLCRVFYRAPFCDIHNRMKTALHILGRLQHPAPRLPLLPIAEAERQSIEAALVACGLLAKAST